MANAPLKTNQPQNSQQTNDPYPELRYLKASFFSNDHRSCIRVGEALLRQLSTMQGKVLEVHRAYIHFFLALSHDDLARQMYDQSKFKITRFDIAENHYSEALDALRCLQQNTCVVSFIPTPVSSRRGLPRDASSISLLSILSTQPSAAADTDDELSLRQVDRLQEHIRLMRERINKHLALIQQAKLRVTMSQAKRAAARTATWMQATLDKSQSSNSQAAKKLQASKSFWLFTPNTMKMTEKEKRIEEGRKRGWTRERFQPAKYMTLAETALAEL